MSQREPEGTVRCLTSCKTLSLAQNPPSTSPPRGEASIPWASAPASTGCLLPYLDTREYERFSARGVFLGTTQGSSAPACTRGADADPLVVDIKDHRCVVGAHQHMAISQVW